MIPASPRRVGDSTRNRLTEVSSSSSEVFVRGVGVGERTFSALHPGPDPWDKVGAMAEPDVVSALVAARVQPERVARLSRAAPGEPSDRLRGRRPGADPALRGVRRAPPARRGRCRPRDRRHAGAVRRAPPRGASRAPAEALRRTVERARGGDSRASTSTPPAPDAFSVRGYERILEEAERLVAGAEERLVVSGWPREIGRLAPELKRAAKRRVYIVSFSHAELPKLPGEVFSYGLEERALEDVLEAPARRRGRRPAHAHRRDGGDRQGRRRRQRDTGHRRGRDVPGRARHHAARPAPEARRAARHGEDARSPRRAARHAARIAQASSADAGSRVRRGSIARVATCRAVERAAATSATSTTICCATRAGCGASTPQAREAWLARPAARAQGGAPLRARDPAQGARLLREPAQPPGPAAPDARSSRRTSASTLALVREALGAHRADCAGSCSSSASAPSCSSATSRRSCPTTARARGSCGEALDAGHARRSRSSSCATR